MRATIKTNEGILPYYATRVKRVMLTRLVEILIPNIFRFAAANRVGYISVNSRLVANSSTTAIVWMRMRVGYVSFRIAGTDGVSLEAERWRKILLRMGHEVTFVAGELDRGGLLVPSLHFTHPEVYRVHQLVIENNLSYKRVEREIFALAGVIEGDLRQLFRMHKFDRLIVANVFSLPMHFPLAVALERVITEYKIPTVARNHDFWWERHRYLKSHCFEFFQRFFPPPGELIQQVTINSIAQKELRRRLGIHSIVIGDCFDFESQMNRRDEFNSKWRQDFSIRETDIVFLQATRIVERKQIELAMDLVSRLGDARVILVLTGYAGDERGEYLEKLREYSQKAGIRTKYIGSRVNSARCIRGGKRVFTLWDCFVNCNWVTYPSAVEGFGNQFIEAVYYKKPIFVNRYPVYQADIEPLGFQTVAINRKVTETATKKVVKWLANPKLVAKVVEKNFQIGKKYFSFEATAKKLKGLGF